ncbi:hypothetical protein MMC25_000139 [Agyrium rufum]|nr:hypothetical protein [Agyrium rufum]
MAGPENGPAMLAENLARQTTASGAVKRPQPKCKSETPFAGISEDIAKEERRKWILRGGL